MKSYTGRLDRLLRAIPADRESIRILRLLVDPDAPADRVTKVIVRAEDGTLKHFVRAPGETKDALCPRAKRAMDWTTRGWCEQLREATRNA